MTPRSKKAGAKRWKIERWQIERADLLRALLVLVQASTILLTWPLWQTREAPPLLPVMEWLPAFSMGPALLVSLAITFRFRRAALLHAALLVVAMLADQTRIQPGPISLALLLLATLPPLRSLAPAYAAALWTWAGTHKLLSPAFAATVAPSLFGSSTMGIAIALLEVTLGALVLFRRTRIAGALALCLHGGATVWLALRGEFSLLPWNVALAAAYFWLPSERSRRFDALLLALPAGFYLGVVDVYLAHVLFTGGVAESVRCDDEGCRSDVEQVEVRRALSVPIQPEERLIQDYFRATCYPGEELFVTPPQTWLHPSPQPTSELCPDVTP